MDHRLQANRFEIKRRVNDAILKCRAATSWTGQIIAPDVNAGEHPDVGGVILELKFTDRFPNWMRDLAQVFGLKRCSVPKYVECASVLKMPALANVDPRD